MNGWPPVQLWRFEDELRRLCLRVSITPHNQQNWRTSASLVENSHAIQPFLKLRCLCSSGVASVPQEPCWRRGHGRLFCLWLLQLFARWGCFPALAGSYRLFLSLFPEPVMSPNEEERIPQGKKETEEERKSQKKTH